MKRVLSVQDISCLGKCSLTVALPVISAAGIETARVMMISRRFPARRAENSKLIPPGRKQYDTFLSYRISAQKTIKKP